MTAATPWSVKGIDPKAREVAKDLARRSGMTLGEWLNRVILEDDVPEEVWSHAHFQDRPPVRPEPQVAPRFALAPPPQPTGDLGRIARALDRLTDRIEASETRTGLAISGVEHSVRQAVARIDTTERAQADTAARVQDLTTGGFAGDPAPAGPRSVEAVRTLDAHARDLPPASRDFDLEQLGRRLAEAEARTGGMLESLRATLAGLDRRLATVETTPGVDLEGRLERLGADLAGQVDAARQDFATQLADAGSGAAEARLAEIALQVDAAEQRSARAIEIMGREVVTLAQALNRRMQASENRGAEALERVSGDVSRVAGLVEARLGHADQAQTDALDKLGAEMGRITERLTERLLNSERRAAQAIDDVGEQMGRVTERFERRQERVATDLAERIRLSEERTIQLLEDARRKLDVQADAAAPPTPPPAPRMEPVEPATVMSPSVLEIVPPAGFDAATAFAPIPEPVEDVAPEIESEVDGKRPLSTREVIDQARAAARAAQEPRRPEPDPMLSATQARRSLFGAARKPRARVSSTLQTALMVAGGAAFLSVGAAGVVLLEGPRPEAVAAVVAPRAAVALAPQFAAQAADQSGTATRYAEVLGALQTGKPGALAALKSLADADYAPAQLFLARLYEKGEAGVVLNPAEAHRWVARAAEAGDPSAMHQLAVYEFRGEGVPQNLPSAASWFRKAAEQGVVDSQYNLALLYRSGSGVDRNLAEAYRWFSVAGANGDQPSLAAARELQTQLTPTELAGANQAAAEVLSRAPPGAMPATAVGAAGPAAAPRLSVARR